MNDARLGGSIPRRKRFAQKGLRRFGILAGHGRFHAARERPDLAADLKVMLGMGLGLPVRLQG